MTRNETLKSVIEICLLCRSLCLKWNPGRDY